MKHGNLMFWYRKYKHSFWPNTTGIYEIPRGFGIKEFSYSAARICVMTDRYGVGSPESLNRLFLYGYSLLPSRLPQ